MKQPIQIISRHRRPVVIMSHVVLTVVSNYGAFLLRFDCHIASDDRHLFYYALPWLVLSRCLVFAALKLQEGLWRYTGIWDLCRIIVGAVLSTAVFAVVLRDVAGVYQYPISIYFLDTLLVVISMGGVRLLRRVHR